MSHVLARNVPDREKYTVSLVVTRAVLVRLSEVSQRDGSIGCRNNLRQQDVFGRSGKHVATTDTTLRLDESSSLEHEKNLFEVGLG
jgi:hypothetical protein